MKQNNLFIALLVVVLVLIFGKVKKERLPRGMRNNNPFNIRWTISNWLGKIGKDDKGFCIFETLSHGVRAGVKNLKNGYFKFRLSISQIVNKYAPAHENDVESYIDHICSYHPDFTPDYIPCNLRDYVLVCKAIVRMEQGYDAVSEDMIVHYLNSDSLIS